MFHFSFVAFWLINSVKKLNMVESYCVHVKITEIFAFAALAAAVRSMRATEGPAELQRDGRFWDNLGGLAGC